MTKLVLSTLLCILILFISSSCKKKSDCGCDSEEIKTYLPKVAGVLSYNQQQGKWMLNYVTYGRAFRFYFPCNTGQDSLKAILQGADQNETFLVAFSGNVKSPCPNEDF